MNMLSLDHERIIVEKQAEPLQRALREWASQLHENDGSSRKALARLDAASTTASQLLGPRPQNPRAIQPPQNKTYTDIVSNRVEDVVACLLQRSERSCPRDSSTR